MGMGKVIVSKKLGLGKIDYLGRGRKANAVALELEIREIQWHEGKLTTNLEPCPPTAHELSICGEIWNHIRTDCYSAGQNTDEIRKSFKGSKRVQRICEIWDRWHLNGMKSGTVLQTAVIDAYKKANPDWRYDYGQACEILKKEGVYEDRGYKYGSSWLCEPLPPEIEAEIVDLFTPKPKPEKETAATVS